ncbi:uncharacterized protein BP5553_06562 [Venustampulla echinocandica]|uniref:Uncharacterized protein n=1 Tax=Venustampulla echinocandica TaxID=2656787 RepID=A0A370TK98_9HELO|nr:uncharacterized protein BP5553_06562 [Venustampulla echinocandica]RDL35950.1 hypothetical protein BP5553_06562 [Venustampulla echinocandica]
MSAVERKKTVVITGCAPGGIGNALAREFHANGLHVIATARSRSAITDLEDIGMTTVSLDVTSEESIAMARKEVEELVQGRGLDMLVNNAGRNLTLPALDVPLSEARLTFETNFFAVVAITQAFTPLLITASPSLILNIGSVAAIVPYVFGSVYNASKAALHAYSNTLRLELEPYGVRVMVVVTGGVKSRIARTERVLPEGSLYTAIEGEFERRVSHSQEEAMDTVEYARGVVREALKSAPKKWFWRGNKAGIIEFVHRWLGGWVFDLVLPRMFGLVKLRRMLAGKGERKGV